MTRAQELCYELQGDLDIARRELKRAKADREKFSGALNGVRNQLRRIGPDITAPIDPKLMLSILTKIHCHLGTARK